MRPWATGQAQFYGCGERATGYDSLQPHRSRFVPILLRVRHAKLRVLVYQMDAGCRLLLWVGPSARPELTHSLSCELNLA